MPYAKVELKRFLCEALLFKILSCTRIAYFESIVIGFSLIKFFFIKGTSTNCIDVDNIQDLQ